MPALHVVYARSHTLGGLLIRAREAFGQWSHCAIVTPDHTVVEAVMRKGVIETSAADFVARYPQPSQRRQEIIPCPDPAAGLAWARSQLGQGYDYLAISGLAFGNSWQNSGRCRRNPTRYESSRKRSAPMCLPAFIKNPSGRKVLATSCIPWKCQPGGMSF